MIGRLLFLLTLLFWFCLQPVLASEEVPEHLTLKEDDLPRLALGSIGLASGFPGFQLYGVRVGMQAEAFGLVLRGSYTPLGPYLSLAVRYYLPIPIPLPTFLSLEGGVFNQRPVIALTAGGHVPLGHNVRLDLEGGVSRVELLGEARLMPSVTIGLSYTFTFNLDPTAHEAVPEGERDAGSPPGPHCPEPREPDQAALSEAFQRAVQNFLAEARVVFAGTYRDLEYSYQIVSLEVSGTTGHVSAEYEGSVREIISGNRVSASGTVSATFNWDGCRWHLVEANY